MEVLARELRGVRHPLYPMGAPGQGIVHVIGPELGLTQPGMTIVCGDSHTSTHGAFGALAFGIGTSEVEHVLATQTLPQARPGTMAVTVDGELPPGVTAKDIVLAIIDRIGTGGGIGSIIEYRGLGDPGAVDGRADDRLQHVDRGRRACRAGRARRHDVRLPRGTRVRAEGRGVGAGARRLALARSPTTGARFDKEVVLDAADLRPTVTWGTNPAQSVSIDDAVPSPDEFEPGRRARRRAAGTRVHGPEGRHADARHRRRHRVHRVVHQLAHRGPARRRRGGRGHTVKATVCARWSCRVRWR